MKRSIDSIKDTEVVHCKTELEAIEFCKLLHEAGKQWCTGALYDVDTLPRVDDICFSVNNGQMGTMLTEKCGVCKGEGIIAQKVIE